MGAALDAPAADAEAAPRSGPPVEVLLGRALSAPWQSQKPLLSERISALRAQQEKATGFAFPAVVFQDGAHLEPNAYEISLHGARHARGQLYPDQTLAIRSAAVTAPLPGGETRDPAFGLPAVWVSEALTDEAQDKGYTLVDPVTVLITHLGEVMRAEAPMLFSRADTVELLESVRTRQPGLLEELIPALMTLSDVQRVLQGLLAEEVSIRNIDQIAETLVDAGRTQKDPAELVEIVRQRLSYSICDTLRAGHDDLAVLSLHPRVEGQIAENIRRSDGRGAFVLDPRLAEQLLRKLTPLAETMMQQSLMPVLLCGPEVRRYLKTFTRRSLPRLAVLSVNEVPHNVELQSFAVLSID
jgi:flagellar biosynthesis protein FlhA